MRKLIRIVDCETTGMDPAAGHVVVEIGTCDVYDDGQGWQVGRPVSQLYFAAEIPPEVRAVHHITAADVAQCRPFDPRMFWGDQVGDNVGIVASHNMEFDSKFLGTPETRLICTLKSAYRVWPEAPAHNNGTLRYWLEDQGLIAPVAEFTQPAHRAGADAYVTAWIMVALLKRTTAREMEAWTRSPTLLPRCPIGEHRGKPWDQVDEGFLRWMTDKRGMEAELVWNAQRELERRRSLVT